MNKHAIYHITDVPYVYGKNEELLMIRIRTASKDIRNCYLYYKDRYDYEKPYKVITMKKFIETELFDYYEGEIFVKEKRYRYYFKIEDNHGEIYFYSEKGLSKDNYQSIGSFQYPYLALRDIYDELQWAQESVVYQIFPDRFNNGDKKNDPENTLPWGEEVSTTTNFGGDLQGIIDKLEYLQELGINIIYLTPIFESSSNHKYNIKDYYKIDPYFGDIDKAKELVEKAHNLGMKIIFDGVFNHTGHDFYAFKDVYEKGEASPYKDWYFIDSFPVDIHKVNYTTFANNEYTLPKLNSNNPEVIEYFLKVGEFWIMELGIDGWRLDVCDEVDHKFWRAFRERIKKIKPDAFIIGEIQHEGISFLKGDQLDSIMNYPFRSVCVEFIAKENIDAKKAVDILESNRSQYIHSINKQLLNLIESHDTPRFLTESQGDTSKLTLAAVLQYTYIGIPYIYYGAEIGMDGGVDPFCRGCMNWKDEKQDKKLLNLYKRLNYIRKSYKSLVHGSFKLVKAEGGLLAFEREYSGERILVVINNSSNNQELIINKEKLFDIYYGKEILLEKNIIKIPPMSFRLLKYPQDKSYS